MKVICSQCGCHFKNNFDDTLKMPCNYWGDKGLANLPIKDRKRLWNWIFSAGFDELMIKYNLGIEFNFKAFQILDKVKFESIVENWNELTEEGRQKFQKEYFLKYGNELPSLKIYYDPEKGL